MGNKIINGFLRILIGVFAFNSIYVFLFTSVEDDFLVLSLFDVSKWTVGFMYLGFAGVLFFTLKYEKKNQTG